MQLKLNQAVGLALTTALISGVSNYLNKAAVSAVPNAVVYTFIKNSLVALALLAILTAVKQWREVKNLTRRDWFKLVSLGVIGGSVPFALFFSGLALTSATSAAFIHKTLFLWVALLAMPLLKERLNWLQGAALALLAVGNFLLGGWQHFHFGQGELLILSATLLWAVETIIAKRVLIHISSTLAAASRMGLGAVVLLGIIAFQGKLHLLSIVTLSQWSWSFITAGLLLGYVLTWYTALKYAPATVVTSLLVPAALITNVLSLAFQNRALSLGEVLSGLLMLVGLACLMWSTRLWRQQPTPYAPSTYHLA